MYSLIEDRWIIMLALYSIHRNVTCSLWKTPLHTHEGIRGHKEKQLFNIKMVLTPWAPWMSPNHNWRIPGLEVCVLVTALSSMKAHSWRATSHVRPGGAASNNAENLKDKVPEAVKGLCLSSLLTCWRHLALSDVIMSFLLTYVLQKFLQRVSGGRSLPGLSVWVSLLSFLSLKNPSTVCRILGLQFLSSPRPLERNWPTAFCPDKATISPMFYFDHDPSISGC